MTHGFAFIERALMRGAQAAPERLESLRGWYPVAATREQIGWRFMGEQRFTEPFFSDTLAAAPRASRLVCQTPYADLARFDDVLAPSAFIFHVSRCGSTLLTQSLAALPHCVVMSEPPVLDAFLREHAQYGLHDDGLDAAGVAALRLLVGALGQRRAPGESAFVVKFDSWHIASLGAIRRAFPATPCIFLYREPDAVLASHRRRRGPQMVPGMIDPARLGIDDGARAPGDLDAYCIAVLERFYRCALAHAGTPGLTLLNYNQLPGAVPALLAGLAIACSADEGAAIRARAAFHSKDAGLPFGGDPNEAPMHSGAVLAAAYAQLEQLRLAATKS
ncbi:MAG: sulfotransferase [Pseudomonadota bacterium]